MPTPSIKIKNLSKIFYQRVARNEPREKRVLKNINLQLNSGDVIGLVGRNGAGKSTLLSLIAGIATPTEGEIKIEGKVTAILTLGIGLREDLTGRENIYLDGELQGKTRAEMDLLMESIINFSELGAFIERPVKTYSTGMKSRLAFSMLVEIEPEILIIDEALSAGDVFFAEKSLKKIREICQKGKIVILVSHSMSTISAMCTRCLWMEQGEIIMDDTPEIVTSAYLEKIKREDEWLDLKSIGKERSETQEASNLKIADVSLKQNEESNPQSVFHTWENFLIEIKLLSKSDPFIGDAYMEINIERIDGMILYHQHHVFSSEQKNMLSFLFQLSLESMVINKGFYQVKVKLFEEGKVTNYFTRLFEVRNNQMPSGGAPLLRYPAEITLDVEG